MSMSRRGAKEPTEPLAVESARDERKERFHMQRVIGDLRPPLELELETAQDRHLPAGATSAAVVIPCFKVRAHILNVIAGIGPEVDAIYVVDDACPDASGALVERDVQDPRVTVLYHEVNQGVGGATVTGMRRAIADGAKIIVKMDGDGQMDPAMLPVLIETVRSGEADHAKGNRFFDPGGLADMPAVRLIGNAGLSFLAKLSTGYWQSFDPTNGYFAIHAEVARRLPLHKIHKRYFFETDLLFRLSTLRARVVDVPMPAIYGEETSNLRIGQILLPFLAGHLRNVFKRVGYNYFLRDFNIASLELMASIVLISFGLAFGLANWSSDEAATAGTVMLAGLPLILGVQLLLAFVGYDIQSSPSISLHPRLTRRLYGVQRLSRTAATLGTNQEVSHHAG
jgi:dolichol-phosphate mannosyltransferase